jgi:hypothetical protein
MEARRLFFAMEIFAPRVQTSRENQCAVRNTRSANVASGYVKTLTQRRRAQNRKEAGDERSSSIGGDTQGRVRSDF